MKNQNKLLAIFTILLIAIPLISSVWWNGGNNRTNYEYRAMEYCQYDTTPPVINLLPPTPTNNSLVEEFTLNVSAMDYGNVSLFVDDGSLVSWWRMDNVSGNTLVDEKGINNGTIYGATQVDGKVGKALSFDGVDDYVNQSRNLTSTDIYGCANTLTFFEYRDDEDVCDFCTPNLVNTSKTSWKDITSCIDGLVNQSRNWTQYDSNDCGEVANETFFEYRTTSCGGTILTAPTISLLNCRIPNTNPLCWFYSFGMSLISKNIILLNGGILIKL